MPITNTTPGYRLAVKNPARHWSQTPTITYVVYEVKRATATQVVAVNIHSGKQEIRVRIADGLILDNGPCRSWAIDITPEIMAQHEDEVAMYRRWTEAGRRLDVVEEAMRKRKLTLEQMEAIATAFETTQTPAEPITP